MGDNPGIGAECIMQMLGVPAFEGTDTAARAYLGAVLLLEAALSLRAIAKGLASIK
jgi:hypothetical protein